MSVWIRRIGTGLVFGLVVLVAAAAWAADADGDGVPDAADNCLDVSNADQADADADGFGNVCDADYDNNGVVDQADLDAMSALHGTKAGDPGYDAAYDLNGDGAIGIPDLSMAARLNGLAPGPSGLACAGTVPCP